MSQNTQQNTSQNTQRDTTQNVSQNTLHADNHARPTNGSPMLNPVRGGLPAGAVLSFTGSNRDITAADILNEAEEIYKNFKIYCKTNKVMANDYQTIDKYYNEMCLKHKDFNMSYPTVMRHMLQQNFYNKKAFQHYLKKVEKAPWTNDESRMDSYADYYILLYKYTTPRYNLTTANEIKKNYRRELQQEHDEFMHLYELKKKDVESQESTFKMQRLSEALQAFDNLAASRRLRDDTIAEVKHAVFDGKLNFEQLNDLNMKLLESPIPTATPVAQPAVVQSNESV